jgi:hypothetical protein
LQPGLEADGGSLRGREALKLERRWSVVYGLSDSHRPSTIDYRLSTIDY